MKHQCDSRTSKGFARAFVYATSKSEHALSLGQASPSNLCGAAQPRSRRPFGSSAAATGGAERRRDPPQRHLARGRGVPPIRPGRAAPLRRPPSAHDRRRRARVEDRRDDFGRSRARRSGCHGGAPMGLRARQTPGRRRSKPDSRPISLRPTGAPPPSSSIRKSPTNFRHRPWPKEARLPPPSRPARHRRRSRSPATSNRGRMARRTTT